MITRKAEQSIDVREKMRGGSGSASIQKLMTSLPEGVRLFSTITLEPGSSIGEHEHTGETELFYFVSGTGRALDDGTAFDVFPGDAMATGSGHTHGIENTGSEPLVLVAAIVLDR